MKYYKVIFYSFCATLVGYALSVGHVFAQIPEDKFFYGEEYTENPTTEFHTIIKDDVVQANDGVVKRILRLFNLDQFTNLSDASALEFVKYIINIALGLVTFIAVIVVIYGFVQVIFAKDGDGVTKARKTITGAAIAIAILAISWFIVTFLFSLYDSFVSV